VGIAGPPGSADLPDAQGNIHRCRPLTGIDAERLQQVYAVYPRPSSAAFITDAIVEHASRSERRRRLLDRRRTTAPTTGRGRVLAGAQASPFIRATLRGKDHRRALRDPAAAGQVNANLAGYQFAAHADVPRIEADWIDDPTR